MSFVVWYLQQLWVVSPELLQQGWQEGWVLLDDLSHLLELRLVPQELQRVPYGARSSSSSDRLAAGHRPCSGGDKMLTVAIQEEITFYRIQCKDSKTKQ